MNKLIFRKNINIIKPMHIFNNNYRYMTTSQHKKILSDKQLNELNDNGFLIVKNMIPMEMLKDCEMAVNKLVDALADKLYYHGVIKNKYEDADFHHRLIYLEEEFPGAAILLHTQDQLPIEFQKLWSYPRLLDLVEDIIGPNIAGHPVWNLRCQTPQKTSIATVPYHQDAAYLEAGAEVTEQPTAWIPLVPTSSLNGSITFLRGGHKISKILPHHLEKNKKSDDDHIQKSWYLYIKEDDLPKTEEITTEVAPGDFVLFDNVIPHCTKENKSDSVRWSLDFRWQDPTKFSGFDDIKSTILMRTSEDRNIIPNWSEWLNVNRTIMQKSQSTFADPPNDNPLDTNVSGPWLDRWR